MYLCVVKTNGDVGGRRKADTEPATNVDRVERFFGYGQQKTFQPLQTCRQSNKFLTLYRWQCHGGFGTFKLPPVSTAVGHPPTHKIRESQVRKLSAIDSTYGTQQRKTPFYRSLVLLFIRPTRSYLAIAQTTGKECQRPALAYL